MKISPTGYRRLFLFIMFPLHFWTILLFLGDIEWIAERTNIWDAIGVGSYGLIAALIESVLVFILILLFNIFIPKQWNENKKIALLAVVYLIIVLWAVLAQLYAIFGSTHLGILSTFLISTDHPFRWGGVLLVALILLIVISIYLPVLSFYRSNNTERIISGWIDRLEVLSGFYLFMDVFAILIILIRN